MSIAIHSYRSVFDLERRIYRVDKLRLNASGVPLRSVAYFVAFLLAALLAAATPLLDVAVAVLPWYMRDLALPLGGAALLGAVRIEGRPFHLAAWALARYARGPSRLLADRAAPKPQCRWSPREVVMLPDGSEGRLRKLRCTGPGAVAVRVAHERIEWRPGLLDRLGGRKRVTVRELADRRPARRAQAIVLRKGMRLWVMGSQPPARAPAKVRAAGLAGGARSEGA